MYHRIEVAYKDDKFDSPGKGVKKSVEEDLNIKSVKNINTIEVYKIESDLTRNDAVLLGKELFADAITQKYSVNKPLASGFSWIVEVSYKPGVTDNVAATTKEAITDIFKKPFKGTVSTARQYLFTGNITKKEIEFIATRLLANPVIETFEILKEKKIDKGAAKSKQIRTVPVVKEVDINVDDNELIKISEQRLLSLNLEEMRKIKAYYGQKAKEREKLGLSIRPTDVELEMIAQTWSEHCKHKIFNASVEYTEGKKKKKIKSLFGTYIKGATEKIAKKKNWLVSLLKIMQELSDLMINTILHSR